MFLKIFGKNPSGKRLERIKRSPHYRDGAFQNAEPTEVILKDASYLNMIRDFFNKPKAATPPKPLPFVKSDLKNLPDENPLMVWFGHSSYLIASGKYRVLVDPVFSGQASPVAIFGKSFPGTDIYPPADFPDIDLLILTHDHYDHLDYRTILALKPRIKRVVTSLGVGSHLEYWGVDPSIVTELDWWEGAQIEPGIHITATPARHFSGRGFVRCKTLWSSFVLSIHGLNLFLGGDSGYDGQFRNIGERFGPFDLAILDGAQYGTAWPYMHMVPEQTVRAAKDLKTKLLLPVHWGKFAMAYHVWNEPIGRLLAAAAREDVNVITPVPGAPFSISPQPVRETWWEIG